MTVKPTVFIHTNDQQIVGALVGAFSMKRASRHADSFDVRLIRLEITQQLLAREGKTYMRKGRLAKWHNSDLQSFSPLRRMVPQLMGFQGRAVVTDPDVFAVGDIYDLLTADMGNKAILCRHIGSGYKASGNAFYASSVMLLDCSKLSHWRWDDEIEEMFAGRLDYGPWIALTSEKPSSIGEIGEEWNSFDKLQPETKLLHMTERSTQPWKTGLSVDFDTNIKPAISSSSIARSLLRKARAAFAPAVASKEENANPSHYQEHPDPKQERFFFSLLKDALEAGEVDEAFIRTRMEANDVRPDAFEILKRLGYKGIAVQSNRGKMIEAYGLEAR